MTLDTITKANDNGYCVIGLFLYLRKLFVTVDSDTLLMKLNHYGIRGTGLVWLINYLNNSLQSFNYNKSRSAELDILCGLQQGSILAPPLLLIYINDLCTAQEELDSIMFADDSNLFMQGNALTHTGEVIHMEVFNI